MENKINNIAKRLKEQGIEFPNVEFTKSVKGGLTKTSYRINATKKKK